MLNIKTNKGRAIVTAAGTFLSLLLCFTGILENLQKLLSLAALLYPAIAGVMFVDFFLRKGVWEDKQGWNFMATIAMIVGIAVGYITTYVVVIGIPPAQSLIITGITYYSFEGVAASTSGITYYVIMKVKAKVAPDKFTEGIN